MGKLSKKPKIYHVDGGAFVEPPLYKFHDAYFSVLDEEDNLIHFQKDLGDMWSGLAEFMAIKWTIENMKYRPLIITSDCTTAIAWARKGGNKQTKKITVPPILGSLENVTIEYLHNNLADIWNAKNHSSKKTKLEYYLRWKKSKESVADKATSAKL